nr:hypothetical protein [Tardibacter chloracetimidivorans]
MAAVGVGDGAKQSVETSFDIDCYAAVGGAGECDAADQVAHRVGGFLYAVLQRAAERAVQFTELLLVAFKRLRMQGYDVRGFARRRQLLAQRGFFDHQFLCPPIEAVDVAHALHQPIGNAFGFLVDRGEPPFDIRPSRDGVSRQSLPFGVVLANVFGHDGRVNKLAAQPVEHRLLDGVEIEGRRIGAVAALGLGRAPDAGTSGFVLSHRGHARTACAAPEQPGKDAARATLFPWPRAAPRQQPRLGGSEGVAVNDRQRRHIGDRPFFG